MTRRLRIDTAAKDQAAGAPAHTGETPYTLQQIYELEKHARNCLQIMLEKKEELKEAKKIYDGAVETLMNTIRKASEPEFDFSPPGAASTGEED